MRDNFPTLCLASQSSRRQELLQDLGITFKVIPNLLDTEVIYQKDGSFRNQLKQLCKRKAIASSKHLNSWVLTADTSIIFNNSIIGKPVDYSEFEEACKIEPKKDYTIWFFALFFVAILVLVSNK